MTTLERLHKALNAVAPIQGVSVGRVADRSTWRVDFAPEATSEQRAAVLAALEAFDPAEPTKEDVDAERDRRMSTFVFAGKSFDLSPESLANVLGAGTLALAAITKGAAAGDVRWCDQDEDFAWIASDNSRMVMDAQTTWAFAEAAAAWRRHIIFRARALKDASPVPADYATVEAYWD